MRQSPSFTVVMEGAKKTKGGAVVYKRDMGLPCELDQSVFPVREAFGEVLVGDKLHTKDPASFQIFFAEGGLTLDSRALVQVAIEIDEALGECVLVVRIGMYDSICLVRVSRCNQEQEQSQGGIEEDDRTHPD